MINKRKRIGGRGLSWPWSYGSWIYNYLCNQCLTPLMLWVWISIKARCTTLCDKVCLWLATGRWFSPGPPVSSTNKTDRYDITEILLIVVLNTIKQPNKHLTTRSINVPSIFGFVLILFLIMPTKFVQYRDVLVARPKKYKEQYITTQEI